MNPSRNVARFGVSMRSFGRLAGVTLRNVRATHTYQTMYALLLYRHKLNCLLDTSECCALRRGIRLGGVVVFERRIWRAHGIWNQPMVTVASVPTRAQSRVIPAF